MVQRIMSGQIPGPLGSSAISGLNFGLDVGTPIRPNLWTPGRALRGLGTLIPAGSFPVPPQKRLGESPARGSVTLAFAVPLFASPALAGAAVFVEGAPTRPRIKHDHGFLDNGKGEIDPSKREAPTERDHTSKEIWAKVILGGAISQRPDLKDASEAYKHFLIDNDGAPRTIRYEGFITEDNNGKLVLTSAIDDTRTGVLDVFDTKFPKPAPVAGRATLQVTSGVVTVASNSRYPYPASENWQKAIGGHALWLSATATIDSDPSKGRSVTIKLTLHAEDMYNFNPNNSDIATNTKDIENGRFEVTGLGREFLQTGTATRTITFTVPNAKQADNRVVPADQKVTA